MISKSQKLKPEHSLLRVGGSNFLSSYEVWWGEYKDKKIKCKYETYLEYIYKYPA